MMLVVAIGSFSEYLKLSKIEGKSFKHEELCKTIFGDLTTLTFFLDTIEGANTVQPLLDKIYTAADEYRWIFSKSSK